MPKKYGERRLRRTKERGGYYATTAGVVHVKAFRSRHDWAHLAAQGSSLSITIDCGGQFLARSHRTALTESQVGSRATRHHYTLIHYGHPTSTNYELRHPRWSL